MRDAASSLKRDGAAPSGGCDRDHLVMHWILQPKYAAASPFMHAVFRFVARPNLQRLALEIDALETLR
eukprot:3330307-Pleurochrysis_carterae.AAC.1